MKKTIIFDFDGVIVNTYDLCFQIRKSLEPTIDDEAYKKVLEGNVFDTFATPPGESVRTVHAPFYAPYEAALHAQKMHSDEIAGLIRSLAARYSLYIVTSAPEISVQRYLEENTLRAEFVAILGADVSLSKVEKFSILFKEYNTSAEESLFITDTLGDIREANVVHLPSIGVSWGFHNSERLEKGSPLAIVHSVQELEGTLSRLLV